MGRHDRRTLLKDAGGIVAATAGLAAFAGTAAAHFPRDLAVDVVPDSTVDGINPRSHGVTRVTVGQTDTFDPASAGVRYRFGAPDVVAAGGGARPVHHRRRDVDGDGSPDLVLTFRTDETGFDGDESREHGLSGRDDVTAVGN